jgi:predicted Zn-dependent protease with MMP-like domain
MEQEEFEEHVREALDGLPDDIARGLENVAVVVEDESPLGPGILGSFFGYPHSMWGTPSGALPAKVVVYRRPLEEAFHDPVELQRQIRITVLHELAHYFGIDEQRIAELGYR